MHFIKGFTKIADGAASGGHNNQGLQFETAEGDPAVYAPGPGGFNPSGIATYQPSGAKASLKPSGAGKKNIAKMIGASLFKLSTVDGVADSLPGYTTAGGAGNAGAGAAGLTQSKYETTSDDVPERMGYNPESKTIYDRYRRAIRLRKKDKK